MVTNFPVTGGRLENLTIKVFLCKGKSKYIVCFSFTQILTSVSQYIVTDPLF